MSGPPPHLSLGSVSREVLELVAAQTRLLDIDATDLLLITCIAFLSTRDALSDPRGIPEYVGGHEALPLSYCRGVITKEVAHMLNMNRETTRRRLSALVERGYLFKKGRSFFMPHQDGETDFTANAREMAVRTVKRLHDLYEKHREPGFE